MATEFEEGTLIPNLALSVIIRPVLDELATEYDVETVQQIKKAFYQAEKENPGITQEMISGVLRKESASINMNKALLSNAGYISDEYNTKRQEKEFVNLTKKARDLKSILSKIPAEIDDRSKFLQTIKDIASAIKELLDAVNEVFKNCQTVGKMPQYKKVLEHNKKEFVKYSKSFSDTLKQYFKDGNALRGPGPSLYHTNVTGTIDDSFIIQQEFDAGRKKEPFEVKYINQSRWLCQYMN